MTAPTVAAPSVLRIELSRYEACILTEVLLVARAALRAREIAGTFYDAEVEALTRVIDRLPTWPGSSLRHVVLDRTVWDTVETAIGIATADIEHMGKVGRLRAFAAELRDALDSPAPTWRLFDDPRPA